jgi:DNA-binding transcriptional LysR family regulator
VPERGQLGALAIGLMMHAVLTVLPRLTREFMTEHPQVRIELREMIPGLLPDAVLTGPFDAAVTFDPGPIGGFRRIRFSKKSFVSPYLQAIPSQRCRASAPNSWRESP